MADKSKQDEIFKNAEMYKKYFKEDDNELDKVLTKLTELQEISDKQIDIMVNAAPGRGVQHNLIEHMVNAISISSQIQAVLKDKRNIKEKALDLSIKTNKDEEDMSDRDSVILAMQKLIKQNNENRTKKINKIENSLNTEIQNDELLDKEIEERLASN